ncbi:protein gp37 [Desulfitobacterium chlororespirans DSM 11544]|uniref:Protein gp37 n=2 Tax=Desulfitobacterium chlororespirans TaxID=51616 RepID=A0A1M7U3L4_9FIRM|nr:phage Gp37/Gp68 family protein [Desulfitobacterium chlororespirans]SHN77483.1 protein gp37 [Desulfitobacterium chlororespirans DSM 11544]
MAENSRIEWTDHTWNPWQGCHPVSPGCDHCYMYRDKNRYGQDPATVKRSSNQTFRSPLKLKSGLVFTCSWSDFFIEEADEWREEAWEIIRKTPQLTYQILTKRPVNIVDRLPSDWGNGWPNVWLGVTAENQEQADKRIPLLLRIPAAVRFVSVEPMLGPINLMYIDHDWQTNALTGKQFDMGRPWKDTGKLAWVICGGETGPGARPMHPDWVRDLRDQCRATDVPFLFKQWGEYAPCDHFSGILTPGPVISLDGQPNGLMAKVGKVKAGRLLDGRTWDEFPEVHHG